MLSLCFVTVCLVLLARACCLVLRFKHYVFTSFSERVVAEYCHMCRGMLICTALSVNVSVFLCFQPDY